MKKIPLTKGKFTLVDDKNYDFLMQWQWIYSNGYAVRNERFECEHGKWKTRSVLMHRVIMKTPKGMMTDHADGDRLNNQEENLRICTHSDNMRNTVNIRKNNTSGFKGVTRNKTGKKWKARIKINNRTKFIGNFENIQDAARAYNEAAIKAFGKFARLNAF